MCSPQWACVWLVKWTIKTPMAPITSHTHTHINTRYVCVFIFAACAMRQQQAPAYIGEMSPAAVRGVLVSMKEAMIVVGMLFGYSIGWYLEDTVAGWRLVWYFRGCLHKRIYGLFMYEGSLLIVCVIATAAGLNGNLPYSGAAVAEQGEIAPIFRPFACVTEICWRDGWPR